MEMMLNHLEIENVLFDLDDYHSIRPLVMMVMDWNHYCYDLLFAVDKVVHHRQYHCRMVQSAMYVVVVDVLEKKSIRSNDDQVTLDLLSAKQALDCEIM